MAGEQQYSVFELALAVVERALAEFTDHDRRAEGDRRDQQTAAEDKPANRVRPSRRGNVMPPDRRGSGHSEPTQQAGNQSSHSITPENMNTMYKWRTR